MGDAYRLKEFGFDLPSGCHVLPDDTVRALDAAAEIVRSAEARACDMSERAELAFEQRRRDGYEAGLDEARRESLRRLLAENAQLDAGLRACEADLARLVASCARKLLGDFDDGARAEAVVRDALRRMRREKRAELRVAPEQAAALRSRLGAILAEFPEIELVDVVPDAALTPPRIVLESRIGRVEGDFAARLAELDELILAAAAHFNEAGA